MGRGLVVGLFALGCTESKAKAPPGPPTVTVASVVRQDVALYLEAVGNVDGFVNAEIRARVRGILQAQRYKDGAAVKQGQLLFTIDKAEYQVALDAARAALARAQTAAAHNKAMLERRTDLSAARVVSRQELEDAEAASHDAEDQVRAAAAQVRQAELNVSYTQIHSPVSGIAGLATVRVGNLVGQDGPTLLTTVSQVAPMRVNFPMSEVDYVRSAERLKALDGRDRAWADKQFAQLERGEGVADSVELVLSDGSTYKHRGVIVAVNRQVDGGTGTIQLQALFPNPGNFLRPGQFARVRMRRADAGNAALLVPEAALIQVQGSSSLAVVGADGKVKLRRVEVGPSAGTSRIVTSGVQAGERVVVDGVQKVSDGSAVVVAQAAPAARRPSGAEGAVMISSFFIRRPIVAIVIAVLTVMLGAVSLVGLPIAQFPQIIPPQIILSTTFTGADATTIEQSVATPIEQNVNGVDNMLYIQSTNANDGTMTQAVTFDVGTNIDIDNVLVQNRFSQAQTFLPQDVKNFGVTIKKSLAFPLIVISLYSPDGRYDASFLTNYATININDALLRIRGVGDIRNLGASDYAMRVWLKPDVLARLGLTVSDVQNAVRTQNVVNPAGQVGAEPALPGQQFTYTVRAQGRLVTPEEFGDVVVRANPDGSLVRVHDVARIETGSLNYAQEGAFNGRPAGVVAAFQLPGSNALDVASAVRATMAELKTHFPPGMDYEVSLDTTAPVKAGIEEILITLAEAIGLVVLVVFVFLQSWRATLIPLLTVPVSLVGVFIVFPFLGFSINTLSLFALVLAIGLVVDDAIVVVEAVEHHIEEGLSPREATFKAMSEVTAPVIGIALILAAVFVPVAFMAGITGRLYQQFALTIAVSVLISAFNALTLSPALAAMLLRPRRESTGLFGRLGRAFNRLFGRVTRGYVATNARLVRKLAIPLVLLVAVAGASAAIGRKLPSGFLPDEDNGYALIGVQLPDAASLQRTKAVFKKVEAILGSTEGVRTYNTIAGYSFFTRSAASYAGTGFIGFKPWDDRGREDLTAKAIVGKLNAQFAKIPEARVFALLPPAIPGISAAGGFSMFIQDRSGGTVKFLADNVKRFVDAARKRPELQNINPNFSPSVPQIFAEVDKEKVMKQGVPIADVYAALQAFMGGSYVNDFTRFSRQWKVFLQADPAYRRSPDDMKEFYVRNAKGEMVPLSAFVRVTTTTGPEYTVRFNLFRSAEIIGAAAPGYSSGQALSALEEVAAETLPPGMGYAWNALSYQEKVAQGGTVKVLGLSLIFVFLILAALYESWSLPFSVLLSTPVAVLGAFLGLLSRKFDYNVYAQIGLVMLVGLTAKNAILIVEFAKEQLERGRPLVEAALEGARLRLRPILMTSFAFIFGCLPLWGASGAGAAARRMLGTTVVTGMLAATLLGIFFVPALFVFMERLAGRRDDGVGRAPAPDIAPPVAAAPPADDTHAPPRLTSVE